MKSSAWRVSVAPMLDWTDKHCRYFHRLLTRHTLLYTEMVTTGALLHGDVARHLHFNAEEHPVALQLGGSEPADLAQCAKLGAQWGYDEINLNCGCPSERVQRGAFGACLMAEPRLVADCVKAMVDVVGKPVTVKHRIGIDKTDSYDFVRDFVGTVAQAGCQVFTVHARNAWLQGLSPKANREVPPLRYALAYRLKADFPALTIVVNGGIAGLANMARHLQHVDGVMIGRDAYHNPWRMAEWDAHFGLGTQPAAPAPLAAASHPTQHTHLAGTHGAEDTGIHRAAHATSTPVHSTLRTREAVEEAMVAYMAQQAAAHGTPWSHIARHMLGLRNGTPGARKWRHVWSDHRLKHLPAAEVLVQARAVLA